jgi:cobalt-zinc-cadmium efflux system outer membrane protein
VKSVRSLLLLIYAVSVSVTGHAAESNSGPHPLSGPAQHAVVSRVTPMSLPEVLEAAQAGNPEIRSALRRVAVNEAKAPAAGALDDPMVMYRDWGTPLRQPWNLNQAQNMLMVQQTFPGFGKRAARSQVAGKEIEVAKAEAEAVRREVAVRVRKAFLDLLRSSDDRRIHDAQARLTREALSSAQVKYTVGKAPQQDVLKAQIALTKLAEHLIGLDQDAAMARAELNTLMGRSPDSPLEIVGDYTAPTTLPALLGLEKTALENRPELVAIKKEADVADAKTGVARLAYRPDFTVAAGYMVMPVGSMTRNTYSAEVTINLPWLNKRKHDAEIAEARTMAEVTRSEYETRRAAVFLEIQQALIRAQAAQRSLKLYQDTLRPQTEATVKAAAAAYQHDRTDFLNLIDSQNMLLDVETSYYKAAASLDARLAELERAIGAPIPGDARAGIDTENPHTTVGQQRAGAEEAK